MKTSFKIDGLADLDRALGELPKGLGKGVLRRTLVKAGAPIDAAWRAKAPKLSGALGESGGVSTKLTRRQKTGAKEGKSYVEVYVGPGALPQATQQEFGNAQQAPQPFMRPAWEETKDQALDIIANGLGDEIAKTAERLAKRRAKAGG